jgi:hypothetical protein
MFKFINFSFLSLIIIFNFMNHFSIQHQEPEPKPVYKATIIADINDFS